MAFNQGCKALVPKKGRSVDPVYMYYQLRTKVAEMNRLGSGSTFKEISKEKLASIQVQLPPLAIQNHISAILSKADAAREKRREANRLAEQLLQSAFLKMFGDPVTNKKGWKKVTLAELCSSDGDLRCGPFGSQLKKEHYQDSGVPVWDIEDVKVGFSRLARHFVSAAKAEELSNYYLDPGDIVVTRRATIGISAVYPTRLERGVMHSALLRVRVNKNKVDPEFLCKQLSQSEDVALQISSFSSGAIFDSINVTKLKSVQVLLPPLLKQREFTRILNGVDSLRVRQKVSEIELNNLFSSLMQKAFRGELVKETVAVAVPRRFKMSPTDIHVGLLGKIIMAHETRPDHKSTLGHVKGEKICHIIENVLDIDLERNPKRMAAGPADFQHLLKVESRAEKTRRFQTLRRGAEEGRKYVPQRNLEFFLKDFSGEMGNVDKEVNRIISLFVPMNTDRAEVVATVYAAWNDLLLEGKSPSDEEIVKDARENWTPEKLEIPAESFQKSIEWLRRNGLVPKGAGKHTLR